MSTEEEYKEEIDFLIGKGIENVELTSNEGKITLAEILSEYASEWYSEHDQGEWGRKDY